ncbi:MAG: DUF4139 domain-containing protein [Desulfopila sp.]
MFARIHIFCIVLFSLLLTVPAGAEIVTTASDQHSLSLTIYNSNLALIRDTRGIDVQAGRQTLAFKEISSKIQPETAVLQGGAIDVLEQNYEYDLLSPESLLRKYVGRHISLVRTRGDDDEEEYTVDAKVLSVAGGVVIKVEDHIETGLHGRVLYPNVPDNLREKPTLTMLVENASEGKQQLELSYLSGGLSWKADYIAKLNRAEDRIDLQGWVTLNNSSGTSYGNAKLQLVAGDVHRVKTGRERMAPVASRMLESRSGAPQQDMQRESLFEYHLYTLERPTTILENQSKQVALLQENNGICSKHLVLRAPHSNYYWNKVGEIARGVGVGVFLHMKNDTASNFGSPKPAGTVRVYKEDGSGFLQFIGEDSIDHTPENETIKIQLGKAFDVTADRIQTDFSVVRGRNNAQRIYESEYRLTLENAKDEPVMVRVEENIPGDWQIISESQPHTKENALTVSWPVHVAAKGSASLEYRVRQIMQ